MQGHQWLALFFCFAAFYCENGQESAAANALASRSSQVPDTRPICTYRDCVHSSEYRLLLSGSPGAIGCFNGQNARAGIDNRRCDADNAAHFDEKSDIYPFADDLDRGFDDRDWFRYFARHGIVLDLLFGVLHLRYRQWTAIARLYDWESLAVSQEQEGAVAGLTQSVNGVSAIIAPVASTLLYQVNHLLPFALCIILLCGSIWIALTPDSAQIRNRQS